MLFWCFLDKNDQKFNKTTVSFGDLFYRNYTNYKCESIYVTLGGKMTSHD